jgi:hypothetical protein
MRSAAEVEAQPNPWAPLSGLGLKRLVELFGPLLALTHLECSMCGHSWERRTDRALPTTCARCHSRRWDGRLAHSKNTAAKAALIGRVFGYLTVVEHTSAPSGYRCQCVCGKLVQSTSPGLTRGLHRSCGCKKLGRLPDHIAVKRDILGRYRAAARSRGYEFSLTDGEFFSLMVRDCHYCGSRPEMTRWPERHPGFKFNGIDRVDNSIGYTLANSVPCCSQCNRAKGTLNVESLRDWVDRISRSGWFLGEWIK